MGFNSAFKGLTEGKNRVACGTKLEAVLKKIFVPVVATNLCACCCYKWSIKASAHMATKLCKQKLKETDKNL